MLKIGSDLSCPICLEGFPSNKEVLVKPNLSFAEIKQVQANDLTPIQTACNHIFHNSCFSDWIKQFEGKTKAPDCPMCRAELMELIPAAPPPRFLLIPITTFVVFRSFPLTPPPNPIFSIPMPIWITIGIALPIHENES